MHILSRSVLPLHRDKTYKANYVLHITITGATKRLNANIQGTSHETNIRNLQIKEILKITDNVTDKGGVKLTVSIHR